MNEIFHGSLKHGLTRIEPHSSSHGNYVYGTPYRELAIIFSARCGDNYTYSLFRNKNSSPWILVERIQNAFNTMFNNSSSIYILESKSFKDINTGFARTSF